MLNELIKNIPDKFTLNINIKAASKAKQVEIETTVRTDPVKDDIVRKLKKRGKEVTFNV